MTNGTPQTTTETRLPTPAAGSIRHFLQQTNVKARFEEVLKDRAPQFIASLSSLVYSTPALREADQMSIIAAAIKAAALDLTVDPNFGFAFIIAYNDGKSGKKIAQFQMGYKGYIQLAMRSGQYHLLNAVEIYEGEIKSVNRLTGEIAFGERTSEVVVGYAAYMKLANGFEKTLYMTVDQIKAHGSQYSNTYGKAWSKWQTDFHGMALKTVIKQLLTKWGILSVEMRHAIQAETPPEENTTAIVPLTADSEQPSNGNAEPDYTDPNVVNASLNAEQRQADSAALWGDN